MVFYAHCEKGQTMGNDFSPILFQLLGILSFASTCSLFLLFKKKNSE